MKAPSHEPMRLLSSPSGTLSSARSGGEGWGEEVLHITNIPVHPVPAGRRPALLGLIVLSLATFLPAAARADAILNECSQLALESALGVGGLITVNCDGTLVLSNSVTVAHDATLNATGHRLTITSLTGTNAASTTRLFLVNPLVHFSLVNVTLTGGRATNGGAIYNNRGFLSLDSCVLSNNLAIGISGRTGGSGRDSSYLPGADGRTGGNGQSAFGGAIYNFHGSTFLNRCSILTNTVTAGAGGVGGDGGNGSSQGGDGGNGGAGGKAQGGAIYNSGSLIISNSTFLLNTATGGAGGHGGTNGTGLAASDLGHGGGGAIAGGGAIYNLAGGVLEIANSTFALNTAKSGNSASAGSERHRARGGKNGGSSVGGAIANYGVNSVLNSTFFANKSIAGSGGNGASSNVKGGQGGDGGAAWGGNLYNAKLTAVTNCTFFDGGATGGTNGLGGTARFAGDNGRRGPSRGGNLANANGRFLLENSLIAFALPGTNGYGAFSDFGYNLSSDRSIRLKGIGSRTNTDPRIALLGRNGGLTETIPLFDDSPAIDAGNPVNRLPTDQRGVPRTYGSRGDIGAYEFGLTLLPPVITTQPQSQTAQTGGRISFLVVARGDPPVTYQWRRGGNPIPGASNPLFTLASVQSSDATTYDVTVANNSGTVTSSAASLTLVNRVIITQPPLALTLVPGGTGTFSVIASGTGPLNYQWLINDVPSLGATLPSFTIVNAQPSNAGYYRVIVYNSFSSVTSAPVTLTVGTDPPRILEQPASLTIDSGETATFSVTANGSQPLFFQWFRESVSFGSSATNSTLIISNVQPRHAGSYTVSISNANGSVTSMAAILVVNSVPPIIQTEPAAQQPCFGDRVVLTVTATGTEPLAYQWLQNGTPIPDATNATYIIGSVQTNHAGTYEVVVTNELGQATSQPADVSVTQEPNITRQPLSQAVFLGTNVVFSVENCPQPRPGYQWSLAGEPIANATNSLLLIASVAYTNAGEYTVLLTNEFGFLESANATLTVLARSSTSCDELAGTCAITFNSQPNVKFSLEFSDDQGESWADSGLGTVSHDGTAMMLMFEDSFTENRIYRVVGTPTLPP